MIITSLLKKLEEVHCLHVVALKNTFIIEDEDKKVQAVIEIYAGKIVLQDITSLGEFIEWHSFEYPNVLSLF